MPIAGSAYGFDNTVTTLTTPAGWIVSDDGSGNLEFIAPSGAPVTGGVQTLLGDSIQKVQNPLVGILTQAQAKLVSGAAFGANFIATCAATATNAKLVGCEIDWEPAAGATIAAGSAGLFINAFNAAATDAGIRLGGVSGGTFANGIEVSGVAAAGTAFGIPNGAGGMASGMDLSQGTFANGDLNLTAQFKIQAAGNTTLALDGSQNLNLTPPGGTTNMGGFKLTGGKVTTYASRAAAGFGVPAIYANGGPQHQTNAAPSSVAYTPPSTAGQYRLTASLLVKTGTTIALSVKVTYTGADGSSHSDVLVWQKENSATLLTSVIAADRYTAWHSFLIDNSAGAITIADNSGTYTTCEYWYQPNLEQLG